MKEALQKITSSTLIPLGAVVIFVVAGIQLGKAQEQLTANEKFHQEITAKAKELETKQERYNADVKEISARLRRIEEKLRLQPWTN